jgi:hypothetical protein
MKNEEGDINKNIGAILFVILVSLFAFIFDAKSNNSASCSAYNSLHTALEPGYYSSHSDAVLTDIPQLPVVVKECGCTLYTPDPNLLNLHYSILDYNRRIVQNIIISQKIGLSIEHFAVWKYSYHLASKEKEDPPFLS